MQYPANGLKTNDTSILILNIIYIPYMVALVGNKNYFLLVDYILTQVLNSSIVNTDHKIC